MLCLSGMTMLVCAFLWCGGDNAWDGIWLNSKEGAANLKSELILPFKEWPDWTPNITWILGSVLGKMDSKSATTFLSIWKPPTTTPLKIMIYNPWDCALENCWWSYEIISMLMLARERLVFWMTMMTRESIEVKIWRATPFPNWQFPRFQDYGISHGGTLPTRKFEHSSSYKIFPGIDPDSFLGSTLS